MCMCVFFCSGKRFITAQLGDLNSYESLSSHFPGMQTFRCCSIKNIATVSCSFHTHFSNCIFTVAWPGWWFTNKKCQSDKYNWSCFLLGRLAKDKTSHLLLCFSANVYRPRHCSEVMQLCVKGNTSKRDIQYALFAYRNINSVKCVITSLGTFLSSLTQSVKHNWMNHASQLFNRRISQAAMRTNAAWLLHLVKS